MSLSFLKDYATHDYRIFFLLRDLLEIIMDCALFMFLINLHYFSDIPEFNGLSTLDICLLFMPTGEDKLGNFLGENTGEIFYSLLYFIYLLENK